MELLKNEETGKWFWAEGHATTQEFDSPEKAQDAAERERAEMIRLDLDLDSTASAGILEWE